MIRRKRVLRTWVVIVLFLIGTYILFTLAFNAGWCDPRGCM
jgi:hypothetical protein